MPGRSRRRADETAVEPTVKFPTLPGREEGPVAEEETVEVKQPAAATAGRGANGVSPARVAPRFDIKPRAAADIRYDARLRSDRILVRKISQQRPSRFGPSRRRYHDRLKSRR